MMFVSSNDVDVLLGAPMKTTTMTARRESTSRIDTMIVVSAVVAAAESRLIIVAIDIPPK